MGKRSEGFERRDKDFYGTCDPAAIPDSFVRFIRGKRYVEPCYGDGDLEKLLEDHATCVWASDIRPNDYLTCDALDIFPEDIKSADCIITNPPYDWKILQPLLDHFLSLGKPTWLLLPADMMHNIRMGPYMKQCDTIVSVGRLYWMENKVKGVDNYAWFKFDHHGQHFGTEFIGR